MVSARLDLVSHTSFQERVRRLAEPARHLEIDNELEVLAEGGIRSSERAEAGALMDEKRSERALVSQMPTMQRLFALGVAAAGYRHDLSQRSRPYAKAMTEHYLDLQAVRSGGAITEQRLQSIACSLSDVPRDCADACVAHDRFVEVQQALCADPTTDFPEAYTHPAH